MSRLHENDRRYHSYHHDDEQQEEERTHFSQTQLRPGRTGGRRHSGNNSCTNKKRYTIANASFGDLLPKPHEKGRTRGQGKHRHQPESPTAERHHRRAANLHVLQTN